MFFFQVRGVQTKIKRNNKNAKYKVRSNCWRARGVSNFPFTFFLILHSKSICFFSLMNNPNDFLCSFNWHGRVFIRKHRFWLRFDYEFCKWDKSSLYDINRELRSFIFARSHFFISLNDVTHSFLTFFSQKGSSLTTALEMCGLSRRNGTLNLERATKTYVLFVINARPCWSWCYNLASE